MADNAKRKLSKEEIQQKELEILLRVQKICEEHELKFYLAGGTLLGAVRHQGFIPWDDDIDICMPRPDYEKLLTIFAKENCENNLKAQSSFLGNWLSPFAKILNMTTEVVSQFNEDEKHLWIDIFPIDGLPADISEVEEIYRKVFFYRRLYVLSSARLGEGKSTLHKYAKYILKPAVCLYGRARLSRKIEAIAKEHSYETSDYVGAVTWGLYGVGERMLKSEYEKAVTVTFEGYEFPAMSCWDSYLTGIYGEYMTPPPPEKRQTHDMVVYVREE